MTVDRMQSNPINCVALNVELFKVVQAIGRGVDIIRFPDSAVASEIHDVRIGRRNGERLCVNVQTG